MLVRKDAYLSIGGLDEGFFMYAEEVDLCYRLRQSGWQVWYRTKSTGHALGWWQQQEPQSAARGGFVSQSGAILSQALWRYRWPTFEGPNNRANGT